MVHFKYKHLNAQDRTQFLFLVIYLYDLFSALNLFHLTFLDVISSVLIFNSNRYIFALTLQN